MPRLPGVVKRHDARLARAIYYVKRDLKARPSLAAVSKIAGLERTYFCKCFRRQFGLGFAEWHARMRIEEAGRLLSSSTLAIGAVALAVGYGDVTTFERNFRRFLGVCPRKYRQQVGESAKNTISAEKITRSAETRQIDRA